MKMNGIVVLQKRQQIPTRELPTEFGNNIEFHEWDPFVSVITVKPQTSKDETAISESNKSGLCSTREAQTAEH